MMARELPKDQTNRGYFSDRYRKDISPETIVKRIKTGMVCQTHHMILNAHGLCPMGCKPLKEAK